MDGVDGSPRYWFYWEAEAERVGGRGHRGWSEVKQGDVKQAGFTGRQRLGDLLHKILIFPLMVSYSPHSACVYLWHSH